MSAAWEARELLSRTPIRGILLACCASAASGAARRPPAMVARKARRGISGKQVESIGAVLHAIVVGSPFGAAGRSRTTVGGAEEACQSRRGPSEPRAVRFLCPPPPWVGAAASHARPSPTAPPPHL